MFHFIFIAAVYAWGACVTWPHVPWGLLPALALFSGGVAWEAWTRVEVARATRPITEYVYLEADPVIVEVAPLPPRVTKPQPAYTPDGELKRSSPPLRFARRIQWD